MHYLNCFVTYDWYEASSGKFLVSCEEDTEAIIQNIKTPAGSKPSFTEDPRRIFAGMIATDYEKDQTLWNNELVGQIPLGTKIKSDLEKEIPLEEQFKRKK